MEKRNIELLNRRAERAKAIPSGCTFKPDISISQIRDSPRSSSVSSSSVTNSSSLVTALETNNNDLGKTDSISASPLELAVKDLQSPSTTTNTYSGTGKSASDRLYLESKERERRLEERLKQPVRQDCTFSPTLISSPKKIPKSYISPPNLPLHSQKSKGTAAAELAAASELTFSPSITEKSAKLINEKSVTERLYDLSWTRMRKDETFNNQDLRTAQKFQFKPKLHSSSTTKELEVDDGSAVVLLDGESKCSTYEGKKRFEMLYSRALNTQMQKEAMKLIVLERELEPCTFAPDITKSSKSARTIGIGSSNSSDSPFHTRLFENAEMRSERQRKLTAAALSVEEENLKGLFSPAITQRSRILSNGIDSSSRPRHEILYQQGVSRLISKSEMKNEIRMSEEDKKECTFTPMTHRTLSSSSSSSSSSASFSSSDGDVNKNVFEKLFSESKVSSTPSAPLPSPPSFVQRTYTGPITAVVRAALH